MLHSSAPLPLSIRCNAYSCSQVLWLSVTYWYPLRYYYPPPEAHHTYAAALLQFPAQGALPSFGNKSCVHGFPYYGIYILSHSRALIHVSHKRFFDIVVTASFWNAVLFGNISSITERMSIKYTPRNSPPHHS